MLVVDLRIIGLSTKTIFKHSGRENSTNAKVNKELSDTDSLNKINVVDAPNIGNCYNMRPTDKNLETKFNSSLDHNTATVINQKFRMQIN